MSIRENTRDKRAYSCRQRVTGSVKVLRVWQTFWMNADNTKSFLHICAVYYRQDSCRTEKSCTSQKMVVGEGTSMEECNHEEANALILVHLLYALQTKSIGLIHTGDTDIVVILQANYRQIILANPATDIWIYFHAGE